MDEKDVRAVIKYLFLKGLSVTNIKSELDSVLPNTSLSSPVVERLVSEFKMGRRSVNDEPFSSTEIHKNILGDKVYQIVWKDRGIEVDEIAEILDMPTEIEVIRDILDNHLKMKKLYNKWVPKTLSLDHKYVRKESCKTCIALKFSEYHQRFLSVEDICIRYCILKVEQKSENLTENPNNLKEKNTLLTGKIKATLFWNIGGVLLIDYRKKGEKCTDEYYINLLDRVNDEIQKYDSPKNKLLYQSHESAHMSLATMAKIKELNFELLPRPPFSPDLSPWDYYCFTKLKKFLSESEFANENEVISAINYCIKEYIPYDCLIRKLDERWKKCIQLNGDYVEIDY